MTITLQSQGYVILGRSTHRVALPDETDYAYVGPSLDALSQSRVWPKAVWYCVQREEELRESASETG